MPRQDRRFKAIDMIRFWTENMEEEEQEVLRCFFLLIEFAKKRRPGALERIARLLVSLIPVFGGLLELFEDIDQRIVTLDTELECLKRLDRTER